MLCNERVPNDYLWYWYIGTSVISGSPVNTLILIYRDKAFWKVPKKTVYTYNALWDGPHYLPASHRSWPRGCWRSCSGTSSWTVLSCLARRRPRVGACPSSGPGCLGDSTELPHSPTRWILRGWSRTHFYTHLISIKDWVTTTRKNAELHKNCTIYVTMYYSKARNKSHARIRGGWGKRGFWPPPGKI